MATYKAAESKREEFRRYLEKCGVLDNLTKVLVALYEEPEKPNDALSFIKQHMTAGGPETADVEALRLENGELQKKNEELEQTVQELKQQLSKYEVNQETVEDNPEAAA
ncbi:c-Myc-binding protein-like [Symsagittifera roscoffensis]|uniref:c-Myc-binding protein-like n=1 Tax=Symsagittifera roscoffensis TaxID=84072 RepID=UPI00307C546E